MERYFEAISRSEIMRGLNRADIFSVIGCIGAKKAEFTENCEIFAEGDSPDFVGVVLFGKINIVKVDFYGNKNIIMKLGPSDMFAESVAFLPGTGLPFGVESETDCLVIKIDPRKLASPCHNSCRYHLKLVENMLCALARKNSRLTRKINILTLRSTREKVLELLLSEARLQNSKKIILEMSRQEMADYLSVDRSALSRELGSLREEKIIDFSKNCFELNIENI